jgi:hypothetical protein
MIILFFVQPKDSSNRGKKSEMEIYGTSDSAYRSKVVLYGHSFQRNHQYFLLAVFFEEFEKVQIYSFIQFLMLYQLICLVITPLKLLSFHNSKIEFSAVLDNEKR